MRILFALLVALNVAYWLWHYLEPPPEPADGPPPVPAGVERLVLLDKRASGEQPGDSTAKTEQAPSKDSPGEPAAPPRACYTLGPLEAKSAAKALAARIETRGFDVQRRQTEEREETSFWLYLPPVASRSDATRVAENLAADGFTDYYIVEEGEDRNAISLGIFSRQEGALRRLRRVRELGYKPTMRVRYRDQTLYWLDYAEVGERRLSPEVWRSADDVQRIARECG